MTERKRFDAYEVGLVMEQWDRVFGNCCSRINSEAEAIPEPGGKLLRTYWGLYGHVEGIATSIGDFTSQEAAFEVLYAISGITGRKDQTYYPVSKTLEPSLALETFYHLVADYHSMVGTTEVGLELAGESAQDRYQTMVGWADEFEEKHRNTDWDMTGGFYEEQETFLAEKLKGLRNEFDEDITDNLRRAEIGGAQDPRNDRED